MSARPPFTPFMQGAPRFTPGLRPINIQNWLAPDTEAQTALPDKCALIKKCPQDVYGAMPGAGPGSEEAVRMARQALPAAPALDPNLPPLLAMSLHVSDDLCLMEKQGGEWVLTAASLCAPTHFSLAQVLGKSVTFLHGPVPDGAPALASKINFMFDRLPPGTIVERFNWTIQLDATRYMPDPGPMRARVAALPAKEAVPRLHLRVERQTIIRLPQPHGVLFCIRVCIDPLSALSRAHCIGLRKSWDAAEDTARRYKHWAPFEPSMRVFFDQYAPFE